MSWQKYNLVNDLGFVKTGVNFFKDKKNYFSTGSIKINKCVAEGDYEFSSRPSRANRIVYKGDVLQARMQNTNKAILIDDKLDGQLFSTGFFQFRPPKEIILPKYLLYFLSSDLFLKYKDVLCEGSTQKAINDKNLSKIYINLPKISEQQRIVAKLDAAFTKIDESYISNLLKKKSIEALYSLLVLRAFDKFQSQIRYVELNELCSKITDGVHKKPDYIDKGVPFLKINNLTEGTGISFKKVSYISQDTHAQFIKRTHPERDDILMTKDGTIGIVRKIDTDIEFSIFVSLALIKPIQKKHSDYLTHVLRSAFCQKQLNPSGTALKHIYLKDLRKLRIPISTDDVNIQVVNLLTSVEEKIQNLYSVLDAQKDALRSLKSAILTRELQGEAV